MKYTRNSTLLIFVIFGLLTTLVGCDGCGDGGPGSKLDINWWRCFPIILLWLGITYFGVYLLRRQTETSLQLINADEGTLASTTPQIVMRQKTSNDASHVEDTDLMMRVRARDEAALGKLFNKHYTWVYNKVYLILTNHQDAEEVAADVFITVWNKSDKWDPKQGRFSWWLSTVAYNAAIDLIRKRGRIQEDLIPDPPGDGKDPFDPYPDPRPGPDREVEAAEIRRILEDALEQVTKPKHRAAWVLRHLEDYSIKEIVVMLNAKESTVKVWILRCKEELRQILTDNGIDWML